jgi:hypothetical protein
VRSLPPDIRDVAAAQIQVLAGTISELNDADLVSPTGCSGWLAAPHPPPLPATRHIRGGLEEQAEAFADPTDEPADRGYPGIWKEWQPGDQAPSFGDVKFYWANAAAYGSGDELRRHLASTARVAAAACRNAPRGRFRTLGHVMTAEDILAVWTVEFVVHQLDLGAGTPAPAAVALTVQTLDGLTGGRAPSWEDYAYIRKGTGREPLTSADREILAERVVEFPAFG